MSESQVLVKCNERIEVEGGSHFVNTIEAKTPPSIDESGTIAAVKSSAKIMPSICDGTRFRRDDGPSSSKLPSISPRSSGKKRKHGYKSRLLASGDDSESGEQIPTGGVPLDQQGRKKRQRRRKNRKYKPYNKLSWQERREQEDRETRRANRVRAQRFANGQPVAPYNTTQFLIDDHNDLKEIDVKSAPPPLFPRPRNNQRARDSSFSLDSEEDFYYSTPEDENEFLTKEFSSAYEDLHAEQLNAQPKTKLVQDILSMEKKLDLLEKELAEVRVKRRRNSSEEEEPSTSDERVVLFKSEILKLSEENNRLRAENECLRRRCFGEEGETRHSSSSVDSDSDSTATSSGTCSSSSCPDVPDALPRVASPAPEPSTPNNPVEPV